MKSCRQIQWDKGVGDLSSGIFKIVLVEGTFLADKRVFSWEIRQIIDAFRESAKIGAPRHRKTVAVLSMFF
jgi:hypothetical protein